MSPRKPDAIDEALENDPDFHELVRLLRKQSPGQHDRLESYLSQDCEPSPLSEGTANEPEKDDD